MVKSFHCYYYSINAQEISLPPFWPRAKQVSPILLLKSLLLWQTVVWLNLERLVCCIFIKCITVKWHVTVSTVCFTGTKSVSLSAGLILSVWHRVLDNYQCDSPVDCLHGVCGLRSAMRAEPALVDVLLARQQPEFPCPKHIGIVRLQVFTMQWRWFGKSISDPFTAQPQESALLLPHSWCSYHSWCLKECHSWTGLAMFTR